MVDLAATIDAYVSAARPWELARDNPRRAAAVCTGALNAFIALLPFLHPILPDFTDRLARLFGLPAIDWNHPPTALENRPVEAYQHLFQRVPPTVLGESRILGAGT